jgi:hypothetical protein
MFPAFLGTEARSAKESPGRIVHHIDLRLVFQAFGGRERESNWLLTARWPPICT